MYRTLTPLFAGMELPLEQLDLSGRGSWRARLDGGAVIELGRGTPEEVTERLQRFLRTLTQVTTRYGRARAPSNRRTCGTPTDTRSSCAALPRWQRTAPRNSGNEAGYNYG